jgi:hypothetical protein
MPPKSKTTSASGAAGGAGAANNQPQASRYNLRSRPVSHYVAKEVAKGSSAASDIIEAANILLAISKGPRVAQPSQSSSSGRKRPAIEISSDDDDSEPDLEAPKAKVAKREPRKTQARKIQPAQRRNLAPATSKRSERILNPNNAEDANLIAGATKVGAEYYDSDADDLSGAIPGMGGTKANLFRHVKWGSYAEDESNMRISRPNLSSDSLFLDASSVLKTAQLPTKKPSLLLSSPTQRATSTSTRILLQRTGATKRPSLR